VAADLVFLQTGSALRLLRLMREENMLEEERQEVKAGAGGPAREAATAAAREATETLIPRLRDSEWGPPVELRRAPGRPRAGSTVAEVHSALPRSRSRAGGIDI
jgi:hypothetical protein